MITTLLLDVDGVLVFSSPEFADAMDREYQWRDGVRVFMRELANHPGTDGILVGDGDLRMLADELLPEHVTGLTGSEFLDRWFRDSITINQELIDLIGRTPIKQVFLATNQDRSRGEFIDELFAAEPWHAGSLISYELGLAKPDPAFFAEGLTRIGARADECLFIDDKAANVEAARTVGLTALQYQSLPQLATALTDLALLP